MYTLLRLEDGSAVGCVLVAEECSRGRRRDEGGTGECRGRRG